MTYRLNFQDGFRGNPSTQQRNIDNIEEKFSIIEKFIINNITHDIFNDNANKYRDDLIENKKLDYDIAQDQAEQYYLSCDEVKKETYLSLLTNMYHLWEKDLKLFICRSFDWDSLGFSETRIQCLRKKVWTISEPSKILKIFKYSDKDLSSQDFFQKIDQCRILINTFKHGYNDKFFNLICNKQNLKYLEDFVCKQTLNFLKESINDDGYFLYPGSEDKISPLITIDSLEIHSEHLNDFKNAFIGFWKFIPDEIELPLNTDDMSKNDREALKWFYDCMVK